MQRLPLKVVLLGTGGTIAGRSTDAGDDVGYRAGEVGVEQLIAAVPGLSGELLEFEQVAQIDSKDMDHATWQALARRIDFHLTRDEVSGAVVTHGTDTLEETAWFLHRVLAPATKPLVLTAAMRPASSLQADGPQNLLDAVAVARSAGACGVLTVVAGEVHQAADLRKVHTHRVTAFSSGDAGPLGKIVGGQLQRLRDWPSGTALGLARIAAPPAEWPWIAVVANHEGADGRDVSALLAAGVNGLVVAGTGNGTLSGGLALALGAAERQGVAVMRASRCAFGSLIDPPNGPPAGSLRSAGSMSPWQARVELLLELLGRH